MRLRRIALPLLLIGLPLLHGTEAPVPTEVASESATPVVSDLRKLLWWRGRWYNATGTSILAAAPKSDWVELASLPDRVSALAGGPHSVAAAGRGFLWVKPRGKLAEPLRFDVAGDWVGLCSTEKGWVALDTSGALVEFSTEGVTAKHPTFVNGRLADLIHAWDQWWLIGQRQGEALILTSTTLNGPWTDASPGGKSPLVRIQTVQGALVVFAADGRVYRAIEGSPWQPVSAAYQSGPQPPLHLAVTEDEGLITLSADALRQSRDGLHWNVLPYPIDEYKSQALVASDFGIVMATLPPSARERPLLLEPASPFAAFRLGQAYASGDGVPLEPGHAVTLLRQAAEAGLDRAKLELAFLIASEQVKDADQTEAAALFLGLCSEPADKVAPAEARQRIEAKARRGHGPTQGVLAVLCRLGFGAKPDSVEATAWTVLAEEQQANLYDLSWYRDEEDDTERVSARVAELRRQISKKP